MMRIIVWLFAGAAILFWIAGMVHSADAQHVASTAPAPDGAFLYQLLVSVGLLASVTGNLIMIFRGSKTQKREVTFGSEFVSVEFCKQSHKASEERLDRLENDVLGLKDEMREVLRDMNASDEERASKIHSRIDELGTALSSQVGELRGQLMRIKGS